MREIFFFVILLIPSFPTQKAERLPNPWTWRCVDDGIEKCIRVEAFKGYNDTTDFETCLLTCGEYGALLPRPKISKLSKDLVYFLPTKIAMSIIIGREGVNLLLKEAFDIMKETLEKYHPQYGSPISWGNSGDEGIMQHSIVIEFRVDGAQEYFTMDTDESYKLDIMTEGSVTKVNITAPTFFGARHAMETLSQLVSYSDDRNSLQMISSANIEDRPEFPHRGLSIDTARNFLSVEAIKRVLDGMSYNKLNTFHWHISDTQSFPLEIKSHPKMTLYGAYSPSKVYKQQDVKDLVKYARIRGVRIIPELDAPSHTAYGWQWGQEEELGNLVVCFNKKPWKEYCLAPPCGQLNLANPNLLTIIQDVYEEILEMFHPVEVFHFGGDEVIVNCWNSSSEMVSWMTSNGRSLTQEAYFEEWGIFQEKAHQILTKANHENKISGILWTSDLTKGNLLDKFIDKNHYFIQIWTSSYDKIIKEVLEKGYKVIFSNYDALYLDCGVGSWVSNGLNWCSPFKGWQGIYDNDLKAIAKNMTGSTEYDRQILGAEAPAWAEHIDEQNLDAKLWPRGAALAERLWTNPAGNYSKAEHRMLQHRERLVLRGIKAASLQPEWCRVNQGECRLPWKKAPVT